jgi:hypothetical protein
MSTDETDPAVSLHLSTSKTLDVPEATEKFQRFVEEEFPEFTEK